MSDSSENENSVNVEPTLDLPKKKKSSKKALNLDGLENDVADLSLKKKKKSKKDRGDSTEKTDQDGEKKKKKKRRDDGAEVVPELNLEKKKKKKPKGGEAPELGLEGKKKKKEKKYDSKPHNERIMQDLAEEDKVNYGYQVLCARVFEKMRNSGIGKDVEKAKRFKVPPPQMVRMGTKRTVFQNFGLITGETFKREHKHVMTYILNELGATGNLDGKNALIIKGKFKPSQMESILKTYIKEYIICKTCKNTNTYLEKLDRLMFLVCHDCSSRSTVIQNKAGFSAVTGKRRKLREQAEANKSTITKPVVTK